MFSQSIKRQSPHNEQLTTDPARADPDRREVAGRLGRSRSRSIGRPAPTYTQVEWLRRLLSRRPRGHVIGRAIAEPPALSVDGRPRGQVVGPAIGEPPAFSTNGRPCGHVVGRASPVRSSGTH
jgi:hypothetical protein